MDSSRWIPLSDGGLILFFSYTMMDVEFKNGFPLKDAIARENALLLMKPIKVVDESYEFE